jgi:hypothetical protein
MVSSLVLCVTCFFEIIVSVAKRDVLSNFEWQVAAYGWMQASPDRNVAELSPYLVEYPEVNAPEDPDYDGRPIPIGLEGVELDGSPADDPFDAPQVYHPFEESGLFLKFGALETSPEAIAEFAMQYGFLGPPATKPVWTPEGIQKDGEALQSWTTEIRDMHNLTALWWACRKGDTRAAQEYIGRAVELWGRDGVPSVHDIILRSTVRRSAHGSARDVFEAGLLGLKMALNRKLQGKVSAVVPMSLDAPGDLAFQPNGLLGALWLQFARGLAGMKQYRECATCKELFEVSPQAARTNRVFCSTACRSRAYRKRKDEARAMSARGVAVAVIAKQLESDIATVQGWIEELSV